MKSEQPDMVIEHVNGDIYEVTAKSRVLRDLEGEPLSSLRIEVAEMDEANLLVVVTFGGGEENARTFLFSAQNARIFAESLLAACDQAEKIHDLLTAQRKKRHAKPTQRVRK